MKRILITGAFGQLGTSLCEVLSNESILATGRAIITTEKYRCIELDITNQKNVEDVIRDYKPDIIIHLAAMTDVDGCEKKPEIAFDVNVKGTKNIFEIAKENEIKVVFASSSSVYGDVSEVPIKENFERKACCTKVCRIFYRKCWGALLQSSTYRCPYSYL